MSRKKKKGKQKKRTRRAHHQKRPATTKALLVIDEQPIRKKAISKCKYILKQFDKVTQEIDTHEEIDQPAFTKWISNNFGQTLTQIRELNDEIEQNLKLLNFIQHIMWQDGLSSHEAYEKALELWNNPEKYREWIDHDYGQDSEYDEQRSNFSDDYDDWNDEEDDSYYDDTDFFKDLDDIELRHLMDDFLDNFFGGFNFSRQEYEAIFKEFKHRIKTGFNSSDFNFEDFYSEGFGNKKNHHNNDAKDNDFHSGSSYNELNKNGHTQDHPLFAARIKQIYRDLVWKLHPDIQGTQDSHKRSIWYRVQTAYKSQDLQELEALWATYDIRKDNNYETSSVSQILAVHQDYKNQLRILRLRHRQYKKDIAWKFSQKSHHQLRNLKKGFAGEYKEKLTDLQEEHDYIARQLDFFKNASKVGVFKEGRIKKEIYKDSVFQTDTSKEGPSVQQDPTKETIKGKNGDKELHRPEDSDKQLKFSF